MRTILVRYKTTETHAKSNLGLIQAVFEQLRAEHPARVRYQTFRIGESEFVHLATVETAGDSPITALSAFRTFQAELRDRCVEPPVVTELSPIDFFSSLPA